MWSTRGLKNLLKKAAAHMAGIMPFKSNMEITQARAILAAYSPKPMGTCNAGNAVEMEYDLQIIIPTYNMEPYLRQCLDSVTTQKTHYQVLVTVIDDGSTDGTADILKMVLGRCGGVIRQENRGLSGARNTGMQVIRGRYVTFLDSDDVLADGAVESMLDAAYSLDADILQGSWYTFCGDRRKEHMITKEGICTDSRGVLSGFPWGKLYKSAILEHFQFPEGYWFEDTPLSFILAAMPYRFAAIKDIVYGYRINPKGITATAAHNKKSVDSYWITEECLKEFPAFGIPYDQRAYEYLLRQSIMNEARVRHQPKKIREAVFVLTGGLIDQYFTGFKTEEPEMIKLEDALRNGQFIRFEFLCLGM